MRDLGHPSILTEDVLGVPKETADPSTARRDRLPDRVFSVACSEVKETNSSLALRGEAERSKK